ncbi:DUF547 domain-containing protein [Polaribacter sp.]|nr:DUF547 domain-containing protein [Polaribacter sp.]
MLKKIFLLIIVFLSLKATAQTLIYNELLQAHVTKEGIVDYKNFNQKKLRLYLTSLEKVTPKTTWSKDKKKAFWINVYNAYTLQIVLDNYPITSIRTIKKEGNTAWKIAFVKVGNQTYTLDHLEHEILRKKYKDPRIHVGVNCASISCPKLLNIAFTEENVNAELEKLMTEFVNDTARNKISNENIKISKIFSWFKEDFTEKGSIIEYLNQYSETPIDKNAQIRYKTYDWNLNEK